MRVAMDCNEQRVYADSVDKGTRCLCPACGETVRLRRGMKNTAHFAHLPQSECPYGKDKDNKSEWHIRMQDYFPREAQERRFRDDETGDVHIADVFLEDSNTVLEFQHSPISLDEFMKRTLFHANNGRRIVWLFDESSSSANSTYGRFKYDDGWYHWVRTPRDFLRHTRIDLKKSYGCYSLCAWTGTEGDTFRRIVDERSGYYDVVFSRKLIEMKENMDVNQFFECDEYWIRQEQVMQKQSRQQQSYRTVRLNVRKPRRWRF